MRVARTVLAGWAVGAIVLPMMATPVLGQDKPLRLELRAGAMYSSVIAEGGVLLLADAGTSNVQTVELQPGVGVAVDAGALFAISPDIDGELRLGVAKQGLTGRGPAGSWDGGAVTTLSMVAGLGVHPWSRVTVRGGVGKLFYSSTDSAFEQGSSTGLLLTGGVGYEVPVDWSFGVRIDGDAQWHGFGSTTLRRAGAPDGSAYEISLKLAATFGGRE